MDFTKLKKKEIRSPRLFLTLQIELQDSTMDEEEACDRLQYELNSGRGKLFSEFILHLLRTTNSSTWELRKLEISDEE